MVGVAISKDLCGPYRKLIWCSNKPTGHFVEHRFTRALVCIREHRGAARHLIQWGQTEWFLGERERRQERVRIQVAK